ncbi:hypothetical protein H6G20_20020 [Desertifilum sp. FACHB-1129]|uniref:hypothetical protein n=1 Tax=unclassified Desertifilum TaxID=2621682 RepID=UPI00130109D1|nr:MULTISPECIES: hypothetical protein [Desertifilum]MBD2313960.1 hypothetical protein [Desertifilum sp. FACHB-1129]MBD2324792.1 hypothetical protein [Desertifilum sp. FACHB-866]MBD2334814.1 hypothetical protein [Desertifilum sp. FACHB-868]MDA0210403.1 hypothetical protein [Cyanobacteria bacterium FC1]
MRKTATVCRELRLKIRRILSAIALSYQSYAPDPEILGWVRSPFPSTQLLASSHPK